MVAGSDLSWEGRMRALRPPRHQRYFRSVRVPAGPIRRSGAPMRRNRSVFAESRMRVRFGAEMIPA